MRVKVDLLLPASADCAPCQDAIDEVDRAAALLAPELEAAGAVLQLRVRHDEVRRPPASRCVTLPRLSINGRTVPREGTRGCGDGGGSTSSVHAWDDATYAAPPAEQLIAAVHQELDAGHRVRAVSLTGQKPTRNLTIRDRAP